MAGRGLLQPRVIVWSVLEYTHVSIVVLPLRSSVCEVASPRGPSGLVTVLASGRLRVDPAAIDASQRVRLLHVPREVKLLLVVLSFKRLHVLCLSEQLSFLTALKALAVAFSKAFGQISFQ